MIARIAGYWTEARILLADKSIKCEWKNNFVKSLLPATALMGSVVTGFPDKTGFASNCRRLE